MKNSFKLFVLAAVLASLTNCAFPTPSAGAGWIYTNSKEGEYVDNKVEVSKSGEACTTNILGIASTGDSSIGTTKRMANIKNIATIDRSYFSILGVVAQGCTVIRGN